MFPGYMLIFHLGRKGEGEGWHMCSLSRFLGHARSCQSRGQTHITLWSSSGVFGGFSFLFSILSGLASTFTSSNPGSWFLGSVSLHATHTRDG